MRHTSIGDRIILNDYHSTPENLIQANNDTSRESKFAIIAEHCFDYYINGITSKELQRFLSKEGIDQYFKDKRIELMRWMSGVNIAFSDYINLRPSMQLFLENFANPSELFTPPKTHSEISHEIINKIREMRKRESDNFDRRARKNRQSIRKLLKSIYQARAKVLVLRIDLWYEYFGAKNERKTNEPKFFRDDIDCIANHRDEFITHLREAFEKNLLGYVWRLEYGLMKGYHLHFLIMLDGQSHFKDVFICQSLGEHWKNEVTKKQGGYFNCNAYKHKYKRLAIGMTNYADEEKTSAIELMVKYLTKFDLLFQVKAGNSHRTLGRSGLWKPPLTKKGRRRSISTNA